jgi:hypothetical protein
MHRHAEISGRGSTMTPRFVPLEALGKLAA